MLQLGRPSASQLGRRNRICGKEHHQTIDEEPEAAKDIGRLHTHLGERSDKAEQEKHLLRIEIIPPEQEGPRNEHGYEDNYAVKQDGVQVVGGGRDKCLTDL